VLGVGLRQRDEQGDAPTAGQISVAVDKLIAQRRGLVVYVLVSIPSTNLIGYGSAREFSHDAGRWGGMIPWVAELGIQRRSASQSSDRMPCPSFAAVRVREARTAPTARAIFA
jgi:hypothetical protein